MTAQGEGVERNTQTESAFSCFIDKYTKKKKQRLSNERTKKTLRDQLGTVVTKILKMK